MSFFLENQWVVGIIGGIISGLIVFAITNSFLKYKTNSKYYELKKNANYEIIRILQPYVAEKNLPNKEVINAIISSIARKYKIEKKELYSISTICEELIKAIVDNKYVSADKKEEYLHALLRCKFKLNDTPHITKSLSFSRVLTPKKTENITIKKIKKRKLKYPAYILISISTSILAAFITATPFMFDNEQLSILFSNANPVFKTVAFVLSIILSIDLLMFLKRK